MGHNSDQIGKERPSWATLKMEAAIAKRWDLYDDQYEDIFQKPGHLRKPNFPVTDSISLMVRKFNFCVLFLWFFIPLMGREQCNVCGKLCRKKLKSKWSILRKTNRLLDENKSRKMQSNFVLMHSICGCVCYKFICLVVMFCCGREVITVPQDTPCHKVVCVSEGVDPHSANPRTTWR